MGQKLLQNYNCVKYKKYIPGIFLTFLLLVITAINTYAQPGGGTLPCDPDETDDCTTPLDNWVFILVAIALIFVTMHLYRKQKLERAIK